MMHKKNPLGENPLNPDAILRDMVRGGKDKKTAQEDETLNPEAIPIIRKSPSTTTPGGLLRKTVYFTETEWRAIKAKAYQEDRPYTDIVREAIHTLLGIPKEPA